MENALLYTFSTIPQTLGAALGVLAAFVLYRLQSDTGTLARDAHILVGEFGGHAKTSQAEPPTTLGDLEGAQKFAQLLAELDRIYGDHPNTPPKSPGSERGLAYRTFKASLQARANIRTALAKAFAFTAAVIVASVTVLTVAPSIACWTWPIGVIVLTLGVVGLAWGVWLCWKVIRAALWID